jgi:hypothetical protein
LGALFAPGAGTFFCAFFRAFVVSDDRAAGFRFPDFVPAAPFAPGVDAFLRAFFRVGAAFDDRAAGSRFADLPLPAAPFARGVDAVLRAFFRVGATFDDPGAGFRVGDFLLPGELFAPGAGAGFASELPLTFWPELFILRLDMMMLHGAVGGSAHQTRGPCLCCVPKSHHMK